MRKIVSVFFRIEVLKLKLKAEKDIED